MGLFQCYHELDGTDAIRAWFEARPPEVRAALIAVTQTLNALPQNQWSDILFKPLERRAGSKKCVGLDELLLDDKGGGFAVCVRVLVYHGPRATNITMLYPFDKTVDRRYGEPCAQAQSRKAEVQNDFQRAKPFWLIPD